MRKTKIICTLGPSTDAPEILRSLMTGGMNAARINFSHGTHADHKKRIDEFKLLRGELGLTIPLLLDTGGPEVRTECFKDGSVTLVEGQSFTLTTDDIEGSASIVGINCKSLPRQVKPGTRILIDDGLIELTVTEVENDSIVCAVINGGKISNRKSVNIPGVPLNMPYINGKDRADILFGIENGFDYVAASFTRSAEDVLAVRKLLDENGGSDIQIIAKIENSEGIDNIDAIIGASDGIMIARGDLGVEIAFEELPNLQKMIIKKCALAGKKVITATQMLDSMTHNPRPTRAETSDVANAIYDGTSVVMLSGETAVGAHPVESLETMVKIAVTAENNINYVSRFNQNKIKVDLNITDAISHATCTTAHDLGAEAIVAVSRSGYTARMISKFRPNCAIIAPVRNERVCRQLYMSWGIYPILIEEKATIDELFPYAVECSTAKGYVKPGDLVVITGGSPVGVSGTTNIMKVQVV